MGSAAHKKDGVPIASRGHSRGHTALKGPFCCTRFHMECVSGIVCNTGLCISVSLSHTRVGKCPVTPSGPLYQLLLSHHLRGSGEMTRLPATSIVLVGQKSHLPGGACSALPELLQLELAEIQHSDWVACGAVGLLSAPFLFPLSLAPITGGDCSLPPRGEPQMTSDWLIWLSIYP